MKTAEDLAEALGLRCAAAAEHRGDSLTATAPPATRWLLIEHRAPWPRQALTALTASPAAELAGELEAVVDLAAEVSRRVVDLAGEVGRLCAAAGIRPVLIRRHGRHDRSTPRRWALVDSRPGQESAHWGELPTDDHLLNVLSGRDPGTPSTDPIYLICTHGRHDACCAIRGRPAAAALSTAFPDQTWECSHIGGDRFAANLVFLPHSLFYGHVPSTEAVNLATHYNNGLLVPQYLRGSGAYPPPVQAAQHFARTSGAPLSINALRPTQITTPTPTTYQIHLSANTTNTNPGTDPSASTKPSTDANASTNAGTDPSASTKPGTDANASTNAGTSTSASIKPGTNASVSASDKAAEDDRDKAIASGSSDIGVGAYVVTLTAGTTTIDAAMTCASQPPGQVTTYTLTAIEQTYQ